MIDTFTGWIEGFPTQTEKAEEVVKKLLHEIIPRFGLPRSLQSDNRTLFTSKVTQGVSKALGVTYLHCAWRPQSSGKVERTNQFLKSVLRKTTQETSLGWKETLPIALLCTSIASKEQITLSLYEILYGRPFVCVNDLFLDTEVQTSRLIPWPWANSNRIYACEVSTRTQKILKNHQYMFQGLMS